MSIGDKVVIHPNVTIMNGCRIGNRVTIHPGTVIGSDGYGFVPDSGRYHKIPQIAVVQIDDDVEIGACNTIDRAPFGRTWIQRGVKTDNLVHIAHNVIIGEDNVIVAQVGIAGSTTIGHHAILAVQAGTIRPPDHRQPCHRRPDDRGRQVDLRRRSRLIRLSIDAPQNLDEGSTRHSDFTGNEEKNCRPGKATR